MVAHCQVGDGLAVKGPGLAFIVVVGGVQLEVGEVSASYKPAHFVVLAQVTQALFEHPIGRRMN